MHRKKKRNKTTAKMAGLSKKVIAKSLMVLTEYVKISNQRRSLAYDIAISRRRLDEALDRDVSKDFLLNLTFIRDIVCHTFIVYMRLINFSLLKHYAASSCNNA